MSQNVNCIGVSQYHNHKIEYAKNWLLQHDVDIAGWQETGVAFHTLPRRKRLSERMKDIRWNKFRISSSNNKHESIDTFQYGGTAVMTFEEVAHRVKATGGDTTGLGRWSWILYEGKNNHKTRIISAYVPCKTSNDKSQSVYNQHKRFFMKQGINLCPRLLMHQHLTIQIKSWQKKGENIVLLIDANENLARMGQLQTKLCYECNLIDPIRAMYKKNNTILPATSLTGSVPIDSIFVSPQLQKITRGGWIRIEDSVGDHRALFIDIPIKTLLGENPFTIHRSTARRLVCDQPKVVEKYNSSLNRQLQNQGTFSTFHQFQIQHKSNMLNNEEAISKLNKIDNSITNAVRYAEKRCRKLKFGEVPYTPQLSMAGKTINLWNNVIRKKKGCKISSRYINRIAKKLGIQKPMTLSLSDCEKERKLISAEYRKIKKDAQISRTVFIQELASQQAAKGNETISNAISRINRNEELRASYKRIKTITKPFCGATEKVLIPDEGTNDERVTTKKIEIEKALCNQNIKKFTSAYSSPFLQEPLISQLGQDATSAYAQQILNGTYDDKIIQSEPTKRFIKQLKAPKEIRTSNYNNINCTLQDSISYWKKKREKTNSSMSHRHIGTYKALTQDNTSTLSMINQISNYAFNLGLPLRRWTKDLDVSLLKKPNKIRPSELRTIGTLEADFNQNAALHFSKRMMQAGLDHDAIPESQYAKKGNRSIEAAIVKNLYFDYLRTMKSNGAFLAMDLENCFDRMAHPISSLCAQRLGVSPNISKCMITSLCKMKHYVRTAYGDSDWYYCGTPSKPLQGAVQGNGAASPMFVAISCVILAYLESNTVGVSVLSAITLTLFAISAIMYVDDSDILIAAIEDNESKESIRDRAQQSATIYSEGVHQTGGAIRPEKCRWYSISFKWTNGIAQYDYQSNVEPITIEDSNGNKKVIEKLHIKNGWKGLGVIASPAGCWNDHVQYLIEDKIIPWNNSIRSSYLQKHDVYRAAFTSIFKTIDYTLPATSLNETQCKKINAQLHKRYLPRIGVDNHMPLEYRYSPKKYQGLGSLNVHVKQFTEKIKILLTHAGTQSQLGKSIQLMLESIQILIGANKPIFSLPFSTYGCLAEKGWIQELWKSSEEYNIKIISSYVRPKINRENDYPLMEKAVDADIYTDEDLSSLNRCRIYLQVQNISEIANGDGTSISYCAKNHIRDPDRKSNYKWSNQPFPNKNDWSVWDDALLHIWSQSENLLIVPPLGPWIQAYSFQSSWKYSIAAQCLYYKVSSTSYNVYKKSHTKTRNKNAYEFEYSTSILPNDCQQTIVNRTIPSRPILESIIPNNEYIDEIEQDIQYHTNIFMNQIRLPPENIEDLIQNIINKTAIAVTDASVSPYTSVGASSFVITSADLQTSCNGCHRVPQGSAPMDSYRAEMYGIYAILVCLQCLVQQHKITEGGILIACDNKASLINSLAYSTRAPISSGSYDILWAIQKLCKSLPLQISYQHVKGHQDTAGKRLTLLEKLNCIMDKRAKQYRSYVETSTTYKYSNLHMYSNFHCQIESTNITENIDMHIQDHIYRKKMKLYLRQSKQYTSNAFESIDWVAIQQASKTLPMKKQIWLTKFTSGFCATASVMKKRKSWDTNLCPICQQCKENTDHLIQCQDERPKSHYQKAIQKLFKFLKNSHTHPSIIQIFQSTLSNNLPTSFEYFVPTYGIDQDVITAAREQDEIGWKNIFKGHLSSKWAHLQMKHFSKMYANPPSLHNWSKNIILQFYDISYSMWSHRNEIVHDDFEEKLNKKESDALKKEITNEYMKGHTNIMQYHKFMFQDSLTTLMEKTVIEKKYWLLTIKASRICFDKTTENHPNMQSINLDHAFVPD